MPSPDRIRNREGGNTGTRKGRARQSSGRRTAILALLLITAAVLVTISLVSYNLADESLGVTVRDILGGMTGNPDALAKADRVHNALGLIGADLSETLIKSTIGYSVFMLPVLMVAWGWTMLRRKPYGPVAHFSNYLLVAAVLLSISFGMLRLVAPVAGLGMQWSGLVGEFLAALLARLLGRAGGSIVLLVSLLIFVVLAVDLDLHGVVEKLRTWSLHLADWIARQRERWSLAREKRREARAEERKGLPGAQLQDEAPGPKAPVHITRPPLEEPAASRNEPAELPSAERKIPGAAERTEGAGERRPLSIEITRTVPETEPEGDALEPAVPASTQPEEIDFVFPSVDLLEAPRPGKEDIDEAELKANADLLRDTLLEFGVEVDSVSVTPGPVVTLYELVPASGVKISQIVSLENDIALKLAARGIRIIAPIPGKSAVGVEIPNSHRSLVSIRSVINSTNFRESPGALPLAMGKTIAGEVYSDDLARMPHLLIAGSTGSGKSVGINTIIASFLYRLHPSDIKFVLVDPKKIELAQYKGLRNHFLVRSSDVDEEIITTPHNAVLVLRGVEIEMERRYERLAAAGVRNIVDYNERFKSGRLKNTESMTHAKMPYLIVIIDELADLMITAAKEVEEPIARLAQLARAVGIHLIVATQRPSVDVITGVIKANFPARIAYQVASKTDSRTILDMNGAEQLLGNGDMLYLPSGSPKPVRLQNAYISPDEVEAVVNSIAKQPGFHHPFLLPSVAERKRAGGEGGASDRDELFEEAARLVVRHQQGSVSLLQRRLKVGYSRAARLVDELEMAAIVGPSDGSKARQVLVETEEELEMILNGS
jgi:S-DNA-T family DNA segregation ATPase FtsK/SpoIIIE